MVRWGEVGAQKSRQGVALPALFFGDRGLLDLIRAKFDHRVFAVLPAVDDLQDTPSGVLVINEGAVGEFEFHDGLLLVEGAEAVAFAVDEKGFRFPAYFAIGAVDEGVEVVGGEDLFVEVLDGVLGAGAVFLEEAGFVFPHAAGDLVDRFINALVHVFGFGGGVDGDVVGAEEDDFRDVAVFLDIENGLGLDDAGVV